MFMISFFQILFLLSLLRIGSPTTTYQIGDEVADFTLRNVDGKFVSLSNFPSAKGFILVFTSNRCPVAKAYEDRLIDLHDKYAVQGYPLILINPNDPLAYTEESFAKMKRLADDKRFGFPYLQDTNGKVANAFGATRTPEVFVLNNENGKAILRYTGQLDDNAHDAPGVTRNYVQEAIERLKQNEPVEIPVTKPIGCGIKWKG